MPNPREIAPIFDAIALGERGISVWRRAADSACGLDSFGFNDRYGGGVSMLRREFTLLGMLVFAASLGYVDRLAVVAVSPTLINEFKMSDQLWGWTNSAFSAVYIIGSILGGIWIDRIGLKRGLAISVAFWTLAAAGHALARDFWTLCLWRMLLALGEAPGFADCSKAFVV